LYMDVPDVQKERKNHEGVVVMTDVDDTIKCSGGPPAGADGACMHTKKHEMYPGVVAFQLALARGRKDSKKPKKVIPLSARPAELSMFLSMKKDSKEGRAYARAAEVQNVTWGLDTENAQYGSVFDVTDFTELAGMGDTDLTRYDKLGHRKFKNWLKVANSFGQAAVFVGDNGQGDTVAAQMMLKRSADMKDEQGALRAAFIHDVIRRCVSKDCRETWAKHGIYMFQHYGDAADIAAELGLISRQHCKAICAKVADWQCKCKGARVVRQD